MSAAASQAAAFYREVATKKVVWTIRDADGFPTAPGDGAHAMPFWSSRSRAERITKNVPAYEGFTPVEIPWQTFVQHWVPGLSKDGLLVGVNWSGPKAKGYDSPPERVAQSVEALFDPSHPWWTKKKR